MVNCVGGAAACAAEEGVKVEGVFEPFFREGCRNLFCGAGNGLYKTAGAEGWTIDEEVELVGGISAKMPTVKGQGENAFVDNSGGDVDRRHCAFADDDTRKVDHSVRGEAVFVEVLEKGVGAVLLLHR